jgi:hypothetical protein
MDTVFRLLSPSDSPYRQEPISIKRLKQGDGAWETKKVILGWLVNTIDMTLTLPTHRVQRLHDILASIHPDQKRIAVTSWQKVMGELRSMVLAIPGGSGLFSTLQEAFRYPACAGRLKLNKNVHAFLEDFR